MFRYVCYLFTVHVPSLTGIPFQEAIAFRSAPYWDVDLLPKNSEGDMPMPSPKERKVGRCSLWASDGHPCPLLNYLQIIHIPSTYMGSSCFVDRRTRWNLRWVSNMCWKTKCRLRAGDVDDLSDDTVEHMGLYFLACTSWKFQSILSSRNRFSLLCYTEKEHVRKHGSGTPFF